MLPSFCRTSLTFKRAGMKLVRGTKVEDWSSATDHVVIGCSVQPVNVGAAQPDQARVQSVEADLTVYAPPGADIEVGDRVDWGDKTWRVTDVPLAWESPTGRVSHTVVSLARWEG